MSLLLGKLFFAYKEVVVGVQLPEATVEHLEVFVREGLSDLVYVFLVVNQKPRIVDVGVLDVLPEYLVVVIHVLALHDALDHRVCLPLLELWGRGQELQARVYLQQILQKWLDVFL